MRVSELKAWLKSVEKAIYIKDYGLKPDVALQVAVSDCKIKIETYFDTKAPKVGKQSDKVVWTNGFHKIVNDKPTKE